MAKPVLKRLEPRKIILSRSLGKSMRTPGKNVCGILVTPPSETCSLTKVSFVIGITAMMSIITARIMHDRITFLPQTRLTFVKTFIPALDPELIKCGYILMQVKFLFNISHVWFHLVQTHLRRSRVEPPVVHTILPKETRNLLR